MAGVDYFCPKLANLCCFNGSCRVLQNSGTRCYMPWPLCFAASSAKRRLTANGLKAAFASWK